MSRLAAAAAAAAGAAAVPATLSAHPSPVKPSAQKLVRQREKCGGECVKRATAQSRAAWERGESTLRVRTITLK